MTRPIIFITGLALSTTAYGTGFELSYQDAGSALRGNAAVASSFSPATVYHNPAGLAFLDRTAVEANALVFTGETTVTTGAGPFSSSDSPNVTATAFVAHPIEDSPFTIGAGLTVPHGLSIEFPSNAPFGPLGYEAELRHVVLTGAIGWQVSDQLSLGAGITTANSDLEIYQSAVAPSLGSRLNAKGTGIGFTAGIQWRPSEKHHFGLSYRSRMKVDYSGSITAAFPPGIGVPTSVATPISTEITFPQQILAGYAWQATDKLHLEVGAKWTDWSSYDQQEIRTPVGNTTAPRNGESSFIYSFGARYELSSGLTLLGGYLYGESSIPDSGYQAILPDADIHLFSIGLEKEWQDWTFSGGYLYGVKEDRTVTGSPGLGPVTSDGRHETDGHTFVLGAQRKF